jgi:hypothetical protein
MNTLSDKFTQFRQSNQFWIACIVGALMLTSFGVSMFSFGYSIDGYYMCEAPPEYLHGFVNGYLGNGRFGRALIFIVLNEFGVNDCYTPTLFGISSIVMLLASLLMVLKIWRVRSTLAGIMIGGLFLIHPYQAEMYTFREGTMYFALAMLLAVFASQLFIETTNGLRNKLYAVLLLVCSLSIYQLSINYAAIVLLFWMCEKALNLNNEGGTNSKATIDIAQLIKDGIRAGVFLLVSVVLYFAANKVVLAITQEVAVERTQMISGLSELLGRLAELPLFFAEMLRGEQGLMPRATKTAVLLLPVIAPFAVGLAARKKNDNPVYAMQSTAVAILIIILSLLMVAGVLLPLKTLMREPRILSAVSLFFAGTLMLIAKSQAGFFGRWLGIPLALLLVIFAGNDNHVLIDQQRLNMRDEAKANRIFAALESLPNFKELTKLVVVNGEWDYSAGLLTTNGDMNVSAYSVAWARSAIVEEVSGHRFQWVFEEDANRAKIYCDTAPTWPSQGSYTIVQGLGIVCLPHH